MPTARRVPAATVRPLRTEILRGWTDRFAIYPEDEVPEYYSSYIEQNADTWEDGENSTETTGALEGAKDLDAIKAAEAEAGHPDIEDP